MPKSRQISLFLLRVSMGWLFVYAGVTKIINPNWSAAGYLKNAATLKPFYDMLLAPSILPIINFINMWGLTLLGLSLIIGLFVRYSSVAGALLMVLYYLPILTFPYVGDHSFIVEEHVIYALVLVYFALSDAGRFWGFDSKIKNYLPKR